MDPKIKILLQNNPAVQEVLKGSDHLGNLSSMEEALILASAFEQDRKTRIIVKKNRYEAQQLYQRLIPLEEDVVLFAMEESLRVQAIASSPEDRESQIDALVKMREDKPKLIIANTAAFLRFLPDRELFDSLCFTLKVDQELSMPDLLEKLNRAGYGRVNYVDRPCTFASRGGIVDIYSLNHAHPVRIEFFDTVIDSIRYFSLDTQRTLTSVEETTIVPATDLLFTNEQVQIIKKSAQEGLEKQKKKLSEEDFDILQDAVESDLRALETYDNEPHLYRYYSYFKAASMLDYTDGEIIYSPVEDIERFSKQLNLDNAAYMQEEVQDHKALAKYTMFHDFYTLAKGRKTVSFHEFVSFGKPVQSEIYPVERPGLNYLAWLPEQAAKENVYLALEEEDRNILAKHMDTSKFKFLDPDFYEGFETPDIVVYTRREIFKQANRHTPYQKTFKEGTVLQNVLELEEGDYVVHNQFGIGQYLGIVTRENNKGIKSDYLHVIYRDGDDIFVPLSQFQLIRKYISKEGVGTKLSKLGSSQWEKTKKRVSEKVEEIAGRLVDLYAARNQDIGYAFPPDGALEQEFDESFEYESTPDQLQATAEIKAEMEKPKPMDHLLCGDVGFGKTEVAMRCAFKAIANGKQVALLCPTTILSMQHYQTFQKRFENVGANIALVNRFTKGSELRKIEEGLENGSVDIVIGTHKLFNKKIHYKDLGFLIIDEEQRFGVEHKEKIKEMKNSIDVLSLSATPIPRTLQMSLIGVRTISQLNTPPAHRHPVQTYVMEKKGQVIGEIIQRELARDGQVFYLHNRVQDIYREAQKVEEMFPGVSVGVAYGRMSREEIEAVMVDFAQGKYQILVCTTIIETGLDIANANTIIIEDADRFGLSQLYQIRGRVGRRDRLAYCYLMVRPDKQLNEKASKRLKSIKEFTQLGSGYKIAMRDLTIRGAGDMLGSQQAGFIDQVGLDMYLELLSEAIARKKGEPLPEKKEEKSAQIQTGGYIPAPFTSNDGDKLSLYQDVKKIETMKDLEDYRKRIQDLFGKIPPEVEQIFRQRRLDLFANEPGVDSMKEEGGSIVIRMTPEWSTQVDGMRLFDAISHISRALKLSYKNQQIQVAFDKKKNYMVMLNKTMDVLMDPQYRRTR